MTVLPARQREIMRGALLITRREVRDQLRDWRILTPIIVLTLFFPLLMNFTAQQAVSFVQDYGANIIAERLVPFLLMVVGFFPISVSLVIALESFAGERERLSLEPLLATPLGDAQLYLGKMLASLVVPVSAAFLGIAVYLAGLAITIGWYPPPTLLAQVILLTGTQALVMVSGAVVVSSQTTSVRAANLLASFIIIPMSQLIIGESMIMFWARYHVLWWVVLGLLLIAIVLGRMGLHLFNREELLGRDIDVLDLAWGWRTFRSAFLDGATSVREWYRGVLTRSLWRLRRGAVFMLIALVAGGLLGVEVAHRFTLPGELFDFEALGGRIGDQLRQFGLLSPRGFVRIILINLRALLIASVLGAFTFGVMAVVLLMVPLALVGYFAANVGLAGGSIGRFLLGFLLPHAILEIPAAILAGASILELGMALIRPAQSVSLGKRWLTGVAEWARVFLGVVLPLLLAAAALEVFVTPRVALLLFAGGG